MAATQYLFTTWITSDSFCIITTVDIKFMVARGHYFFHFCSARQALGFALMAEEWAFMSTLFNPYTWFLAFNFIMSIWIILCLFIGMTQTLAWMPTVHPYLTHLLASSFRHLLEVFHRLNHSRIIMIHTFEHELLPKAFLILQMINNLLP